MKHLLSILLLSIILAACSSDPIAPPATDGTPIKLSLRIATQSKDTQSKDTQSKANALPTLGWNYEQGDELIENWVVIMVNDADHTIEQVFTPTTSPNNVEADDVATNLQTTASNKTFYSFANISLAQLEQATGHTFAKGGTMPDIASATWHIDGNGFDPKAKDATGRAQGIPMTGICHMSLTNKDNETTKTLYVVRMLAKLQFNITNKTGANITLNTISIDRLSANPASGVQNVMLFPSATPTDANTQVVQQPRLNGTQPQQVYTLALNQAAANDASITQTLYVNECTTPANPFGQFMLTVRLTMADGTTTQQRYSVVSNDNDNWHFIARNDWRIIPITLQNIKLDLIPLDFPAIGVLPCSVKEADGTFTTQQRYSVVSNDNDNWHFIARNDWRIIPITLQNIKLDLIPLDFPAIGVLPCSVKEADGTFTCTFNAGGEFRLTPKVTRFDNGAAVPDADWTFSRFSTDTYPAAPPAGFYAAAPSWFARGRYITGTFGTATGQAYHTLYLTHTATGRTLVCRVRIVRP